MRVITLPVPARAALADADPRAPARGRRAEEPARRPLFPVPGVHVPGARVFRLGVREVHRPGAGALHHAPDEPGDDAGRGRADPEVRAARARSAREDRRGRDPRRHGARRRDRALQRVRRDPGDAGAGEALSVGGSALFLRSKTGNPMDVHINTGANTRRYLLRQPELSRRIKLQALLVWNTGPEVRMAQRMLASDVQPEPERVAALPSHTQDELLEEIESLISRLPVGE